MKNLLLSSFFLVATVCSAQTNLVPNPTFEKVEKKIKDVGEINVAIPWTSPTLVQADLYVPKTKNYYISIPENAYGEEKPMEGTGYAGIMAYSYKNKVPRSYLQVQLTEKLEAGREYCIKYHVSLADLSKYATNHLGVALTSKAMTANNSDVLKFDNYIESRKLTVYDVQFYWTPICGVYKAKGGEEYLTIGNFTDDLKLVTKKVKRPRGFTKPQKYDAYYYIDNVSVILAEKSKKCDCDVTPGMENVETVRSDFSSDKSVRSKSIKIINSDGTSGGGDSKSSEATVSSDGKVDGMKITFEASKFSIENSVAKLDKIVAYLKENIDEKVSLSGYIDESEKGVDKLAGRRVGSVYKYLVSKGVSKERIDRNIEGFDSPIDKKKITKNMRVEISIVLE
ncbi:MAG: OmpA family protein [Flavobacteriales bacterium]|nr:OmpA family protein [Flavobacteriales bacterium]